MHFRQEVIFDDFPIEINESPPHMTLQLNVMTVILYRVTSHDHFWTTLFFAINQCVLPLLGE